MEEIVVKVDVPKEFSELFTVALAKALKRLVTDIEFSMADSMLSKSKLTDEQVEKLSSDLKERVVRRHAS